MKKVKNEKATTIEGKPLRIPETNSEGDAIIIDGKPKMRQANLKDLIRLLIFNLPLGKFTMEDSIIAHRVFQQIDHVSATDGYLPIEDNEHKWLLKVVNDFGPSIFGVNAVMVKDALDNFERLHEPKIKKS